MSKVNCSNCGNEFVSLTGFKIKDEWFCAECIKKSTQNKKPQQNESQQTNKLTKKQKIMIFIITVVFDLIIISLCTEEENVKGLGVKRNEIIAFFGRKEAGDFFFKEGKRINNQPNYVAQQEQNIIQLIGEENNLSSVSFTAILGNNAGKNLFAIAVLISGANLIETNSIDWLNNLLGKISKTPKKEQVYTTNINNKKINLNYTSIEGVGNILILTFNVLTN